MGQRKYLQRIYFVVVPTWILTRISDKLFDMVFHSLGVSLTLMLLLDVSFEIIDLVEVGLVVSTGALRTLVSVVGVTDQKVPPELTGAHAQQGTELTTNFQEAFVP